MDAQDLRGVVGDAGAIGDQGIVALPLDLSPEEKAAQEALNQSAVALVAARNALAAAEEKFNNATAIRAASSEVAAAQRAAKVSSDRAAASTAAAAAASSKASADALAAKAAIDQSAADEAQKVLDQKNATLHTLNGQPI